MSDNNENLPPDDTLPPETPRDESGGSQPGGFELSNDDGYEDVAIERNNQSLSGGSKRAMIFGVLLVSATVGMLYYLFSSPPPPPEAVNTPAAAAKPSNEVVGTPVAPPPPAVSAPAALPSPPPAPPAPPPPPPPPPKIKVSSENSGENPPPPAPLRPTAPPSAPDIKAIQPTTPAGANDKRLQERMKSNMLLLNGGAGGTNPEDRKSAKSALDGNDPNAAFASNVINATNAEKVVATRMTNLAMTIAQGKIINAVLETAVNTDLPGTLRAIISRDVYAESGKAVLIPKGSRLIGTYNTGITRGQKRVMIIWTRVLRPDGIDIMIGSPGVDSLGRAGVEGLVDNKYMETYSAALLTSLISVGVAVAADAGTKGTSTSTSNTDGSSSSTGSPGAAAATNAVNSLGDVSKGIVGNVLDLRPTITIDQGTRINVFVNKDLTFPTTASSSLFVQ